MSASSSSVFPYCCLPLEGTSNPSSTSFAVSLSQIEKLHTFSFVTSNTKPLFRISSAFLCSSNVICPLCYRQTSLFPFAFRINSHCPIHHFKSFAIFIRRFCYVYFFQVSLAYHKANPIVIFTSVPSLSHLIGQEHEVCIETQFHWLL